MVPLDAEEMAVRAVRRLITNSIRLLGNHTGTIPWCGLPGLRAICQGPTLRILETLWMFASLPSYVTFHIN